MSLALTIAGGIVTAIITAWATVAVSRINSRATRDAAIVAPYDSLAGRLEKVESKLDEQKRITETLREHLTVVVNDRDSLVAYVKQLAAWVVSGAKPPAPPVPAHLHDLLDPGAFEVARVTEISRTITQTERTFQQPPEE